MSGKNLSFVLNSAHDVEFVEVGGDAFAWLQLNDSGTYRI